MNEDFCVTKPNVKDGISVAQAMLAEAFMTGILVWVVNAAWDRRCQDKHDSLPVKFGLAIIALALPGVSPQQCPSRAIQYITKHMIELASALVGAFF